jgi:2-oxoglutarate dehydrogenase E1 component
VPDGFHLHPKVAKLLEQRAEMGEGERPVDYGMAEALAFGSPARPGRAGAPERPGQPAGTFNQRHAVLIDVETRG